MGNMMQMNRRTRMIITVLLGVFFGCAGIFTCLGLLLGMFGDFGTLKSITDSKDMLVTLGTLVSLGETSCWGLGLITLPVAFYLLLVHGQKE